MPKTRRKNTISRADLGKALTVGSTWIVSQGDFKGRGTCQKVTPASIYLAVEGLDGTLVLPSPAKIGARLVSGYPLAFSMDFGPTSTFGFKVA